MIITNPQKITQAEIAVGIPSYNEAGNIGFVVEQVSLGLEEYFPDKKSVIINLDNNSTDGTKKVFFRAKGNIPRIYVRTAKNIKGKGYNFHNLFLMVKKLKAKVGIVLDADLTSLQPDWIKKMAGPVFAGYEFVAPYYARFKNDATITNQFVYPLVYGLLGWDIRQPIGGDFAFADKMVDCWLKEKWLEATYQFGIDIFMSLTAFFAGKKTCQVNLGAKIHQPSDLRGLGLMFCQVTEVLFEIILKHSAKINEKGQVKKVAILGEEQLPDLANHRPDYQSFQEHFLNNFDLNWPSFKNIVSQPVYQKLSKIHQGKQNSIDPDLWTKIVYDFLSAYRTKADRLSLVETLKFLYFGRVATFSRQVTDMKSPQVEKEVIKEAQYFFKKRNYFLNKLRTG